MLRRSSASCNSLIAGRAGEAWALLARILAAGLRPTRFTFAPLLSPASLDLVQATQLHSLVLKTGLLHSDPFSATALLGILAKNGVLGDAVKLFEEMPIKAVVTWNSLVSGFSHLGLVDDSMFLFRELLRTGMGLSECSFLSILAAFRSSDCLLSVEQVHGLAIRTAIDSFVVVANALLNVLSICSGTLAAKRLFDGMFMRDVVSWNTMIAAFGRRGMPERAMELFWLMSMEGDLPNETTFVNTINACSCLHLPAYGEFIHAKAIKHNLNTGVFMGSALIDFYAKWKSLRDAQRVFNETPDKNVVCWNALISGYSTEVSPCSLVLIREMLHLGVRPNEFSFSSALKSATASDIQQLHALIIRMGYDSNEYVSSAIVASYAANSIGFEAIACGSALEPPSSVASANVIAGIYNRAGQYQKTQELLSQLQDPDTVSLNILLTACARNGDYLEAVQLFERMRKMGNLFDNYTVVSLLSVCSRINSLKLGQLLHGLIIKTNSGCLDSYVNNLLLDMYAKCGSLEGCLKVFEEMGERNLISWTALISGLGLHGCTHEALERFKQMEREGFKPDRVTLLTVLSACRHGGLVEEGMRLFNRMKSDYGIEPEMDHYICLVDLLCKYGHLKEAELVISSMPFQPNAVIWRTFLQGCKKYASAVT